MNSNIGLVLEGGGFRGIFTAAVLDVFQKENLYFNYAIGVSAGVAYSVSYIAGQYGRNLEVNKFVADKRYCGLKHLLRQGNYFNWEFVYKELPTSIIPFDYEALSKSVTQLKVVVTHCATGKAEYKTLKGTSPDEFRDLLTATSSIPLISRMKSIDNQLYLDGGIADSIPIQQAFADGMQRAVVILTQHKEYRKEKLKYSFLVKLFYRRFPQLIDTMLTRADKYNQTLDELEKLEKEGKVFIIRPDNAIAVSRMENNPKTLQTAYDLAFEEAEKMMPRLKEWLNKTNK